MANGVFTPYSTVSPLFTAAPSWVPLLDQERIQAYQVYEEIYWNVPQSFSLLLRGADANPLYLPSARIIVNTMNRYCGKGLGLATDPLLGTPADRDTFLAAVQSLFRRERFGSRYNAEKRMGLIRGDWVFHISADPKKAAGTRIRVLAVDPGSWFPVYADDDLDRLIKVHLAEQIVDSAGKAAVKRQTYTRLDNGTIQSEAALYDVDKWDTDGAKLLAVITPPFILPPSITSIPVYHFANREEGGNPYGSSEIRGLEKMAAALNQSISDEDLTLALDGLGIYAHSGGEPVDPDTGEDTDWIMGPGRVLSGVASDFRRVNGTTSVEPYGNHIERIWGFMRDSVGASDAAVGKVDVTVAESGVALAMQLAPIIAESDEKDQTIKDKMTQMLYDLKGWFQAYESLGTGEAVLLPTFADKIPANRKAEVELVSTLVSTDPPIMSTLTAREHLTSKFGFTFAEDEVSRIAQEAALLAEAKASAVAAADPYAARLAADATGAAGADTGAP